MNLIETLHYPVVIHYYGDDELEYVASAQQLQDLSASFVCDDALIDSQVCAINAFQMADSMRRSRLN